MNFQAGPESHFVHPGPYYPHHSKMSSHYVMWVTLSCYFSGVCVCLLSVCLKGSSAKVELVHHYRMALVCVWWLWAMRPSSTLFGVKCYLNPVGPPLTELLLLCLELNPYTFGSHYHTRQWIYRLFITRHLRYSANIWGQENVFHKIFYAHHSCISLILLNRVKTVIQLF